MGKKRLISTSQPMRTSLKWLVFSGQQFKIFNLPSSKTDKGSKKLQQINVWHFCLIKDLIQSFNQLLLIYFPPNPSSHTGRFPSTGNWKTPNERHLIEVTRHASSAAWFWFDLRSFHWLKIGRFNRSGKRKKNKCDFKTRWQKQVHIRPQCLFSSVVSTYRYNTVSFCKTKKKKKLPLQSSMLTECQSSRLHSSCVYTHLPHAQLEQVHFQMVGTLKV